MTERRPPDPSLQVEGDELTSTNAVMADGPLTTPELPDTDGDDTVMLEGPPLKGTSKVTARGLGPSRPAVHVHRPSAQPAPFEIMNDVAVETALTAHGEDSDGDELDRKIRRHLAEGHQSVDPLLGTVIGERFEVISKLGAGGMGAVYRAKQLGMGRDVAIKVLHQDLAQNETIVRRFTIEALAVSRLKHPNTIQIFDFGRTDRGNLFIAMELLEGKTLNALLSEQGRVPIRRALRIIAAASNSLAEAHNKEIIHRDLKPENIFLTQVGDDPDHVKVLDFGVAKLRDGAGDGKGTLTKAGSIFGTPRYMSPEQASARPLDARSDLYSLGVILYELICGEPPFDDERPLQLLIAHANRLPSAPSSICSDLAIPQAVEELILRLLDKSPHSRVQSASELSAECLQLVANLPEEFEQHVPFASVENLCVELSAPVTMIVPRVGAPEETFDVEAPPTIASLTKGAPTVLHEPQPPPRRGVSWVLMGIGVAGVSLLAVVIGMREAPPRAGHSPQPLPVLVPAGVDAAAEAPRVVALPASATVVRIAVLTRPAGAQVHALEGGKQGALLGSTPLDLVRPRHTQLIIRVVTGDHRPVDRELRFVRDMDLDLTLLPVVKPISPPVNARPHRGKRGGRKVTRKPTTPTQPIQKPKPKGGGLVDDLM